MQTPPWNKGRVVGQKTALTFDQVRAIRPDIQQCLQQVCIRRDSREEHQRIGVALDQLFEFGPTGLRL